VLEELRIENLLLIPRAELRFGPGLNAITGETGAGKTILAHSLDLLMGGRPRPQIVRPGAAEAYVEGVFALPERFFEDPQLTELAERLPDESEQLVLGRRVGASGRSAAFVQGRSASAADLRALGSRLLAFYGQHEHRKLTLASAQLEILDAFAGPDHLKRRAEYRKVHAECTAAEAELRELEEREGGRERDLDLYRYELSEIEAAAPDSTELDELEAERQRLRHAEGLRAASGEALAALAGADSDGGDDPRAAAASLAAAEAALAGNAGIDPALDGLTERIGALAVELDDSARELRGYLDGLDADPQRLQSIEERLDAVDRLKRKHGGSIDSVLAHAVRCRELVERLEGAGERSGELNARLGELRAGREKLATQLTKSRRAAAGKLEKQVVGELAELAMEGAAIAVKLEAHSDGHGASGAETAKFEVATNPGIAPAPLRDAASGGELSRLMLALCGLGREAGGATLVFDEIDAGVGGNTARAVGERLRALGADRQVICITHLPQVASLAATHFRISKSLERGRAMAAVELVEGEELVAEICRMLGADLGDDAASRHARELLAAA
jgi:DNA repair protein RecN (Recombination protein N)